jgi:hypothetical protein
VAEDRLQRLERNLYPNEASGLLAVEDEPLLEAHGWELAFWAVLGEGEIEDCVAIIGHRRGADITEGWEIERLRTLPPTPTPAPSTPSSSRVPGPAARGGDRDRRRRTLLLRHRRGRRRPPPAHPSPGGLAAPSTAARREKWPPGRCALALPLRQRSGAGSWHLMIILHVIFHFTATSLGPRARTLSCAGNQRE